MTYSSTKLTLAFLLRKSTAPAVKLVTLCALLQPRRVDANITKGQVDDAAHEAASSPLNDRPNPTGPQIKAGNYKLGHVKIGGLDIRIENPAGSAREGKGWRRNFTAHYGYFAGTEGRDGDAVDVFIRPGTPEDYQGPVHVVDQPNVAGNFDEHKVLLGWPDVGVARAEFRNHYPTGWNIGFVSTLSFDEFKDWLYHGDTKKPIAKGGAGFNQSSSATSGLTAYHLEGQRRRKTKPKRLTSLIPLVTKGDVVGHEFHGNQWTSGQSGMHQQDKVWHRDGAPVDAETAERLRALGVPPAWVDVKLNPDASAALQVTGKDTKGRTQSIYSAEHSARAAAEKFERLKSFEKVAPTVHDNAIRDMQNPALPYAQRDVAATTALIAETGFRVGSDADTGAEKKAYGASNLLSDHVQVRGSSMEFNFTGKKGVSQSHTVDSPEIAAYVMERQSTAGERGGRLFTTTDAQVRDYFKSKAGSEFKVKDFRTRVAAITALREVDKMKPPTTKREYARARVAVGKVVGERLGNTHTMALNSYIPPAVFAKWGFQ